MRMAQAVQAAEGTAPLAAAAPASVDPETELMQKRRQESAEKRAALADALVIANEVKAIATAAGPVENGWVRAFDDPRLLALVEEYWPEAEGLKGHI